MSESTSESAAAAAPATDATGAPRASYGRYMKAWITLLVITVIMVFVHSPTIILIGILAKVSIIAAVFMHLKDETLDFVFIIAFSIVFFSALLFGLMVPDALAM